MRSAFKILANRIEHEINDIETLISRIEKGLEKAKVSSDDYYIDGVALNLHGFYSGIERIFQVIAENIDGEMPSGYDWHQKLLLQMAEEVEGVRPAVISSGIKDKQLQDYRGFRHVVRNVYSHRFNPDKIEKLVIELPEISKELFEYVNVFITFLRHVGEPDGE